MIVESLSAFEEASGTTPRVLLLIWRHPLKIVLCTDCFVSGERSGISVHESRRASRLSSSSELVHQETSGPSRSRGEDRLIDLVSPPILEFADGS
jgi:hypothetical protein